MRWQNKREKIKQARFKKENEKEITRKEKINEIKSEIAKRWFYAYNIMENIKKQDEDEKVEERHKTLKKLIRKERFDKFFGLFKMFVLVTFTLLTVTAPFVILFFPRDISEEYKFAIILTLWIILLFCTYKVLLSFLYVVDRDVNNVNFLRNTFWFSNPEVLILSNVAIIWEKVIKIQNWDISWQELILSTLYVTSKSEIVENLISENQKSDSSQIKLLQKRLEINKNILEKKISELDSEIKKLES